LCDFKQIWIFSTDFHKGLQYKFEQHHPVELVNQLQSNPLKHNTRTQYVYLLFDTAFRSSIRPSAEDTNT